MTLYEATFGELPFSITSMADWQKQLSRPEPITIPTVIRYPIKTEDHNDSVTSQDHEKYNLCSTQNSTANYETILVDPDLHDLLTCMLCKDLSQRMLLRSAAMHPFFRSINDVDLSASLASLSLSALKGQSSEADLQKQKQERQRSIAELYNKALSMVHRGSYVQKSFYGLRAVKRIQSKMKNGHMLSSCSSNSLSESHELLRVGSDVDENDDDAENDEDTNNNHDNDKINKAKDNGKVCVRIDPSIQEGDSSYGAFV
uniref:Histone-lysine N-methyltransferase SETD1B n=1 Tax=Lygus hesperus TaxID=30085 RepID=A0A0A9WGT8_LYGHE